MTIGMWVVLAVIGFALGNMMAIKPRKEEMRLDELRMMARKLQLHPKLVPIPAWIPLNKPSQQKNTLIMQYSLIDDSLRLPLCQFIKTDKGFELILPAQTGNPQHNTRYNIGGEILMNENLANLPMFDYIFGVSVKANAVQVFWQDERFSNIHAKLDDDELMAVLSELKQFMTDWADNIKAVVNKR
ncbi:MAG: hypothetical protein Q4G13_08095 [Moraxella sp.]|nr:hypothetical protein [Moraxella sp.]